MIDPSVRPVKVERPEDATGLVDTGKLVQLLDQDDAAAVMLAMEQLSELKLERMTESDVIEQLIRCGLQGAHQLDFKIDLPRFVARPVHVGDILARHALPLGRSVEETSN